MNFDNSSQNSGSQQTTSSHQTTSSQSLFSGLEQSLITDGETILEHAAVGVVAGLL